MGQVRKTKIQIENEISDIHRLQVHGVPDDHIRQKYGISIRNWNKTYRPGLRDKWKQEWLKRDADEQYQIAQQLKERLMLCYINAKKKAEQPNSAPGWGELESQLALTLFDFEKEGVLSISNGRLIQIEQKIQGNDGQGSNVLPTTESTEPTE